MNSLTKWMDVLRETVLKLMPNLPISVTDKMRNKLINYVKTYAEPEIDEDGKLLAKIKENNNNERKSSNIEDVEQTDIDEIDDLNDLKTQMPL